MSYLTRAIGKVFGKRKAASGRSELWYYLLDDTGKFKRGQIEQDKAIKLAKKNFECWELERIWKTVSSTPIVDYIFVVKNNKGEFMGTFQIAQKCLPDAAVTLDYTYYFKDEYQLHDYNRKYEHVVSYKKVN